ncbi:MAG: hypothetical protein AB8B53_04100 [Flavobacteriales bacterium]
MAKVLYFIIGAVFFLSMSSCLEKEEFPDEPVIKFMSIEEKGNELELKFSFTDGDGNFGLEAGDTLSPFDSDPYQQNLIVSYYELQNGEWQRFGQDFPSFSPFYIDVAYGQRVPLVEPTGQREVQEGEVTYDIVGYYNENSPFDTARFEFFIYDRSLNASNVEVTSFFIKP